MRIQWLWCQHFSRLRMKIDNWKICHWPILAVYLKDFFCRRKSIYENFVNWKLRPLLFLKSWFIAFFHLKSQRQRTLRLLFEDCWFTYFHSLMKSAFLPSKGLLCLYDKQNKTWLLVNMEFLFSCSTRREIPYLRAPIYYSLFIVLPTPHPMYYSLFIMLPPPHSRESKAI